jgi:vacuolar-type H+-ATPase subunit I/STV1
MPPLTDEHTRRNVIREWILGFPRDTIAQHNSIGAGTVSSIISNYKAGLEELDFDSIRQLAVEARQHGWNFADLASHARLYNYFIKSGAAENKVETLITKVSTGDVSPERVIALVNELFNISKEESIPFDQVSEYIKEKLQEKQKINDQIKEADAILQSKNVSIEAVNEHIQLNEKLNEYNLSFQDIDKLLNVLINAKENGFDGKKIVGQLRSIQRLEKKKDIEMRSKA